MIRSAERMAGLGKVADIPGGLRPLITVIARDDNADDERTYATCYE